MANKDKIPTILTVSVLHHYQYVYTVCSMNHKFTMKHVAFPICKTYDKTYIHLCFGDWMACFCVILVMNQICLKIIYNLFCLTVKAAAQRFCASVECWNKAQRKFKFDYYIEESNQPKEGCHYQLQNDKMYLFFVSFFFWLWAFEYKGLLFPLMWDFSESLLYHFSFSTCVHIAIHTAVAMFNFMDGSKFMTILHQCFLPSKTFYYNYN